jgi:hypothetical protein
MSRLKDVWRILNLPCREMARLASESLDRDLDGLERSALRLHLLYCLACRRYSKQLRFLRAALRNLATRIEAGQPLPGPGLPEDVRDRIKHALKGN